MNRFHVTATSILLGLSLAGCPLGSTSSREFPAPAAPASEGSAPDSAAALSGPPARAFSIQYEVTLSALPADQPLRLWIPLPSDDPHQKVKALAATTDWKHQLTHDEELGNRFFYFERPANPGAEPGAVADHTLLVEYSIERSRYEVDLEAEGRVEGSPPERFLLPSRLVVVDDQMRRLAESLAEGAETPLAKARAFYDHVQAEMTYDKSGDGWGRGDSVYACEVGRGNCTDFHAYFMALCRAAGIPIRFQIGIYGKYEPTEDPYESQGYHCWAEFWSPNLGWVPVDISEGDKKPELSELFFGGHTSNRVTLTTGRDLVLSPPQAGQPLNYMVEPYAEVGGKAFTGVSKRVTWTDAAP